MVITKIFSPKHIFAIIVISLIYYIILYAYNNTNHRTSDIEASITIRCLSNVCVFYDDVKECIHFNNPMLFRIESSVDVNYSDHNTKNIDFEAIKDRCG